MFKNSKSFFSYSVDDVSKVKDFYTNILGLNSEENKMGMLTLNLENGGVVNIYPKGDAHKPADYTVLNFIVDNIEEAVDKLISLGVNFEHYDSEYMKTDEKGIARGKSVNMGPDIAWFKDPAGNIISVLED